MRPVLLVSNDFPPKRGGIQTYLWELWRRLPPGQATVLTASHPKAAAFDAGQAFRIERTKAPVLVPTPSLVRRIRRLAEEVDASMVLLDPALPLGAVGPHLQRPYAVVVHGSELLGRLPGSSRAMAGVLRGASRVVAAGAFPAAEVRRLAGAPAPPLVVVPPGVDTARFSPVDRAGRTAARLSLGLDPEATVVAGVSRLVPRKGFDVLVDAAAELGPRYPGLVAAIGGEGRDRRRLEARITRRGAPAVLLGPLSDDRLVSLYRAADVFAMCCRTRWAGLEPEGFGIVFLEAAACGVPQVAGDSGGATDAVVDGETGTVVRRPRDARALAVALEGMLRDPGRRLAMARRSRERAVAEFTYDRLAALLAEGLGVGPVATPAGAPGAEQA